MKSVSNVYDWHQYVYAVLAAILAVCLAIQADVINLPPYLEGGQFYAAVLVVFISAFLPRIQTQTGPGAPPILSPPVQSDAPSPKV